MIITIANDKLTVQVNSKGAQLWSIQTNCDHCEYLWQGDPTFWAMRATVLFPICGRLYTGKYTWKNKEYEMVLHGVVKETEFQIVDQTSSSVTLEKCADELTKQSYPFDFILRLTYSLNGLTLTEKADIINLGNDVLPFSFGGHPGFNVPLNGQGKFENYRLVFGKKTNAKYLLLSPTCFCTGKDKALSMEQGDTIRLQHNWFDNDAVFVKDMADSVTLCSDLTSKSVTLSYPEFKYIGFWHRPKTEAPYICMEPWYGIPSTDGIVDDFSTKQDMEMLPKGQTKTLSFAITITE